MASGQKSVEIDNRLTDLFISRRNQQTDTLEDQHMGAAIIQDDGWLMQFQASGISVEHHREDSNDLGESAAIAVDIRNITPFWVPEDVNRMLSLWKKSKTLLSKDCQKQRKAALRKSSNK